MQRFKAKEGRDPTDGELSSMIKQEHRADVPTETFGDARRCAKREDKEIEQIWSGLSDYEADWI